MAVTLKGLGAVWGVGDVSFTGLITSAEAKYQSLDFARVAQKAKLQNEVGDTAGEAYYDQEHTLTVTVIPTGATVAAARTNLSACLPAPGTLVTFVDPESTIADGTHTGKYIVDSARNGRTNTGYATIILDVHQAVANDVSATI